LLVALSTCFPLPLVVAIQRLMLLVVVISACVDAWNGGLKEYIMDEGVYYIIIIMS
jgi:hypothetical protein